MNRAFGLLFLLTGVFAIVGGLYTWGDGSILAQSELVKELFPWADIVLTGPLSLVCGHGIWKEVYWGRMLGLITSGVYMLGSMLVFISMIWNRDYSVLLIVPAISGLLIALGFTASVWKEDA